MREEEATGGGVARHTLVAELAQRRSNACPLRAWLGNQVSGNRNDTSPHSNKRGYAWCHWGSALPAARQIGCLRAGCEAQPGRRTARRRGRRAASPWIKTAAAATTAAAPHLHRRGVYHGRPAWHACERVDRRRQAKGGYERGLGHRLARRRPPCGGPIAAAQQEGRVAALGGGVLVPSAPRARRRLRAPHAAAAGGQQALQALQGTGDSGARRQQGAGSVGVLPPLQRGTQRGSAARSARCTAAA